MLDLRAARREDVIPRSRRTCECGNCRTCKGRLQKARWRSYGKTPDEGRLGIPFRGEFEKVRLSLRPEDVFASKGLR